MLHMDEPGKCYAEWKKPEGCWTWGRGKSGTVFGVSSWVLKMLQSCIVMMVASLSGYAKDH